jgi:hypothetical protein
MGLFKKSYECIDTDKLKAENTYIDFNIPIIPKPEEPKEEWIWVEGYKGVNENMQGYGGFQYELGVEYSIDGEIEVCKNGFHFSKNLTDAFYYKDCLKHRFFKVKGLVKASDAALYGKREYARDVYGLRAYDIINKLAAKKIILTEEITNSEEIMSYLQSNYPEAQTFDDINKIKLYGYSQFVKMKYGEMLSKYFSVLFVEIFIERFDISILPRRAKEILAYMEEGVSKDVAIYLLMKD